MTKKTKNMISALLAVSVLGLSACSSDTDSNAGPSPSQGSASEGEHLTLTWWHYYNKSTNDALEAIIAEFNEGVGAEKGITMNARSYSSVNDLATAVVDAANKEVGVEDLPHIFSAYSDTALVLSEMGLVADMDQYFSEAELDLFLEDFLLEGRFTQEESLNIIPVAKSTEILFYNETDFQVFAQETGVEVAQMATWEGMAEVAEIYYHWTDSQTPEEDDGRALFGIDSEANFMLVAAKQLGEEMYLYEEDGSVSFGLSEKAAKEIWNAMLVPYLQGYYTAFGSFRSDDVKSGDLLVYSGSTSSVYFFPTTVELGRSDAYDIVGAALPYPYFENGEKVVVQQGAGMVVAKSDSAHEAAAAEFLKWFTSAEYNLDFAVSTGYMPVQKEALSLEEVLEVMEAQGEVPPVVRHSTEVTYQEVLPNYEFYANKPFDGSFITRNVLRDSFVNVITQGREQYDLEREEGRTREEILLELTGEAAFQQWYQDLEAAIQEVLA